MSHVVTQPYFYSAMTSLLAFSIINYVVTAIIGGFFDSFLLKSHDSKKVGLKLELLSLRYNEYTMKDGHKGQNLLIHISFLQ